MWTAALTPSPSGGGAGNGLLLLGEELEAAILDYLVIHNEDPKPFVWTKTADQILASVAR